MDKNDIDVSAAFSAFLTFNGDADKTALVLDVSPEDVRSLARSEGWDNKRQELCKLREGSQGFQLAVNRAVNYVQAHRARTILDRVIRKLGGMDDEALIDMLTPRGKNGPAFNTKPLTDMVRALEVCQRMTYAALGDPGAQEATGPANGRATGTIGGAPSVALAVLEAMNAAESSGSASADVVRQQLSAEAHPRLSVPKPATNA